MDNQPEVRTLHDVTFSVDEVAERLNLTKRTTYLYLKQGLIPCIRIGRKIRVRKDTISEILAGGIYKRVL